MFLSYTIVIRKVYQNCAKKFFIFLKLVFFAFKYNYYFLKIMDIQYNILDLFCGCGGLSKGFKDKGFTILGGIDNDEQALKSFLFNFPESRVYNCDISKTSPQKALYNLDIIPEQIDVLIGGPPCQGFSKINNTNSGSEKDERNELVYSFLNYVEFIHPAIVLIENVPELFYHKNGKTRRNIIKKLQDNNYNVSSQIISMYDYGLPQKRRRYFILAALNEKLIIPEGSSVRRSAWDAISDLPVVNQGEGTDGALYQIKPQNAFQRKMRKNSAGVFNHFGHKLSEKQTERIKIIKPGETLNEADNNSKYSGVYGRLDYINPAPTVTASAHHIGAGRYIHPREDRVLTVRELARLQSFPDDFRFFGTRIQQTRQVGNAVPPMFAEYLASIIKKYLRKYKESMII